MNEEIKKEIGILKAHGNVELMTAEEADMEGNHGKSRTCARRAVGFYAQAYLLIKPEKNYGENVIQQLKGINEDNEVPEDVKKNAELLLGKVAADFAGLEGKKAIESAKLIINYLNNFLQ